MILKEYKKSLNELHEYGKSLLQEYKTSRPLLISGNDKTGQFGRYGVMKVTRGLPIWDCPSATELCRKACYAIKYTLWNAGKKRDMGETYSYLSHHDTELLHWILRRDVAASLIYAKNLVTRIHDSGDFVSVEHVNVYHKLAREFPDLTLFGFSRSFDDEGMCPSLLELARLPNVKIRYSVDRSSQHPGKHPVSESFFDLDTSLTRERLNELYPDGWFRCAEQLGGPKCIDCGMCFKVDLPLILNQH